MRNLLCMLIGFLLLLVIAFPGTAQTTELKTDDGSADGTSILQDGLLCVNRLTPTSYPATLNTVRISFVQFSNQPSPIGQRVRLVVFTDENGFGKPPNSPIFLVDEFVTVPDVGSFFNISVKDITIKSGDFYVGYQVQNPAQGVGFACDTNGFQQERGFFSSNSGQSFIGPLTFSNGTKINLLIRASVFQENNIGREADLRISVNPNPIQQDLSQCGTDRPYFANITLEEVNGVGLTLMGTKADFFNTSGQFLRNFFNTDTLFTSLFNDCSAGKTVIPANGRLCGSLCIGGPDINNGGAIQITFFASDINGNKLTFVSPMLTLVPPSTSNNPTINAANFDGVKTLTILGNNFGNNARVLINGTDRSTKIKAASNTSLTIKGKAAKLGIMRGNNTVQVTDSSGRVSNIATFNF